MSKRGWILACVVPGLKENGLKNFLTNLALFARRNDAELHVLSSGDNFLLRTAVAESRAEMGGLKAVFHSISEDCPDAGVAVAFRSYPCDLVVAPVEIISDESNFGKQIRKYLFEQALDPVMLLSNRVNLEKLPIESILIPMSGEIRVSSALKYGLRLASRSHIPVDLVHVTVSGNHQDSSLESLGDQSHHEYRDLLDRVLAEASPFSNLKERAQVRTLYEVIGLPATEILKTAQKTPSCAILLEWHGSFDHGKAETLKALLSHTVMPIIIVKAELEQKSTLKIGPENRVA